MRFWSFLLIFLTVFLVQQTKAESLSDAMIAAYKNSNLLAQNRTVLRAADEELATAVSDLRPIFDYSASRVYVGEKLGVNVDTFANYLTLSGSIELYNFGRGKLSKAAAQEFILSARQTLVGVEQSVLLTAVNAFVDVRLAQETVSLRQNNYRLISQELDAAKARFEVGEITQTDVAIAQ